MTNKFKFSNSFVNHNGKTSTLELSFDADSLSEVLDNFESFLAGCGYVLEGNLVVVNDEDNDYDSDEMNSYLDDLYESSENCGDMHSEK